VTLAAAPESLPSLFVFGIPLENKGLQPLWPYDPEAMADLIHAWGLPLFVQ
jgi:hypothetical protein